MSKKSYSFNNQSNGQCSQSAYCMRGIMLSALYERTHLSACEVGGINPTLQMRALKSEREFN